VPAAADRAGRLLGRLYSEDQERGGYTPEADGPATPHARLKGNSETARLLDKTLFIQLNNW